MPCPSSLIPRPKSMNPCLGSPTPRNAICPLSPFSILSIPSISALPFPSALFIQIFSR